MKEVFIDMKISLRQAFQTHTCLFIASISSGLSKIGEIKTDREKEN